MTPPQEDGDVAGLISQTFTTQQTEGRGEYVEVAPGSALAGRYRITSKLGEGGMGVVYSGQDEQLARPVAVKLLKRNVSRDEAAVERLKQEAQVAMMLTHPAIMRLINFERDGEYALLLMEYIEGRDLKYLAARRPGKRFDPKSVAQIAYKICAALDYAHKRNVIHRDIKPANIMITTAKEVKLMDFGIARALVAGSGERPEIAGTLAYMAPEIFEGAHADARCDLYALGLTMYELLAGGHPFHGATPQEIISHHRETLPGFIEGVDRELFNIIAQCVEKKPNARYQSAEQLHAALGRYLGIDEKDKVSKLKMRVEHERRKLEGEKRRMEQQKEQMEAERKKLEDFSSTSPFRPPMAVPDPLTIAERLQRLPLPAAGVAAVCALLATAAARFIADNVDLPSLSWYELVFWLLAGPASVAGPMVFRHGVEVWRRAALIGLGVGIAGFTLDYQLTAYFIENDIWFPYGLVTHTPMALALGFGAAFADRQEAPPSRWLARGALAAGVGLAVSSLAYAEFAEISLGLEEERSVYFYAPLAAAVAWLALGFFQTETQTPR